RAARGQPRPRPPRVVEGGLLRRHSRLRPGGGRGPGNVRQAAPVRGRRPARVRQWRPGPEGRRTHRGDAGAGAVGTGNAEEVATDDHTCTQIKNKNYLDLCSFVFICGYFFCFIISAARRFSSSGGTT